MPPLPLNQYTKPALTPTDLLAHLQTRGLTVNDQPAALHAVETVGYYRLLIYMRALQVMPGKTFVAGTTFADIVTLCNFDRELRILCLDAIERIEVALRASIVNELAVVHGPHFYLDPRHFATSESYRGFFSKAVQARYLAITHYERHYNLPPQAPIWAICEAVTFGTLSHLYSGLNVTNRKLVARPFGFSESVLLSWFRTLNDLRNICAHHNRLWNTALIVNKPMQARAVAAEKTQTAQEKFYGRAVVLVSLLNRIEPTADWKERLKDLLARYGKVPLAQMGFTLDWRTRPFWV